jgi:hypothetical protein
VIVSHRHRFVFVKTRKTAGTSLEVYLSGVCGDDDIVTPIVPHVEPHRARNHDGYFNHMPAAAIRDRVGRAVWDGYVTFCVERNPWDKTLSYYHMQRVREGGGLTFDDYLRTGELPVDFPQYTASGTVIVDRVLRYERLDAELADVFARVGVPFPGTLDVRAKSEYRTDRRPYQEVYTREQADIVRQAFAAEIAHFGYEF